MKSYDEICKEVGFNQRDQAPTLVYSWVAYDKGNVIACKSQFEASKYTLNEKVVDPTSKQIHDEYFTNRKLVESIANDKFVEYLREEYDHLSYDMFQVCYNEAYSRGHSSGHDMVVSHMKDVVEFAELVRSIK